MKKNLSAVLMEGVAEVARRNGVETGRYYHGPKHTAMVMVFVKDLGERAGVGSDGICRLVMDATWHDTEQSLGRGWNEKESARLLGESMRRHGYTEEEIEETVSLIPGTIVYWLEGVMHQQAEGMDLLAKLLADADLCALGARGDDFADMSLRLMAEFAGKPISEFTAEEVVAGWKNQVKFMTGRKFLTKEANDLMGEQFLVNLKYARNMAGLE